MAEADVLLLSDYSKGGVTETLIKTLITAAVKQGVPVVANPKPKSLEFYRGATLVSLNRFEAAKALGTELLSDEDAPAAAQSLRDTLGVESVLVTLGGSGMVAAWAHGTASVPAVRVEVYDEAGAGDTVIATIALGVAAGALGEPLLALAAQTAAAVVQKVGVAAPSREDLARIASL
jgi:D-beta-D-heptose 7-phosphate kinase/D-beta-D-heptose 1-phosphate adenosyltransferase